ncbi:MAG TPA: energy transducer TonB [Polyangia bacterium]|nr:energy transducer TonB [Polyangia bacterium]
MTVTIDPRGSKPRMRLVRAVSCAPIRPRPGTSRARRRAQRGRVAPLPAATAAAARASLGAAGSGRGAHWAAPAVWGLALAAHALLALAVWRTHAEAPVPRGSTRISVQVHEVPPPPPRPVVATPATKPAAPARPGATRVARHDAPRATRPQPPAAAPVKVVGLSLESTSESGRGPAFAVGDTLAGSTAATAQRPAPAPAADPPAGPNRVARGVPRAGSVLTPPRRLQEVKPHYPDARRAAGVEADVLLIVSLDASGRVLSVTVGHSSGDQSFDESARQAARQERFSPALRDGVPVPTTFTFTTHFRLDMP